jgi:hypothetical protein
MLFPIIAALNFLAVLSQWWKWKVSWIDQLIALWWRKVLSNTKKKKKTLGSMYFFKQE